MDLSKIYVISFLFYFFVLLVEKGLCPLTNSVLVVFEYLSLSVRASLCLFLFLSLFLSFCLSFFLDCFLYLFYHPLQKQEDKK